MIARRLNGLMVILAAFALMPVPHASHDGNGNAWEGGGDASVALARNGGCGAAVFWAATADADLAVTITIEAGSRPAGEPTVIDFALPDDAVLVEVQRGRALTQAMCNDVVDATVWRVDERLDGVSGSGRITLGPPLGTGSYHPCGATGELRFDHLVAEDGTRLDDLKFETDGIDCYAG